MIRVTHLITSLGTGGAERMLLRLVIRSDRSRFRHRVVSMMDEGRLGSSLREAGIPVTTLNMSRGIPSPAALLRLVGTLRQEGCDVLQSWLYHADLMAVAAGKLAGVPRLAWNLRCSDMDFSRYGRMTRWLVPLAARLSPIPDAVVVNSVAGQHHHQNLGYRPRRWEVIPNGIDLDHFRPDGPTRVTMRRSLGLADDDIVVGLVARADPMKDHAGFLAAAAVVARANPRVRFVLAGLGVTESAFSLGKIPAGRVLALGERADVAALTAAFDIAVSGSAFGEGFSNAVAEAMACAVPCVVTDVGDSASLVGETGRVVAPRQPEALAAAILAMIDDDRCRLGEAARGRIEAHYGLDAVVVCYERFYESLR